MAVKEELEKQLASAAKGDLDVCLHLVKSAHSDPLLSNEYRLKIAEVSDKCFKKAQNFRRFQVGMMFLRLDEVSKAVRLFRDLANDN